LRVISVVGCHKSGKTTVLEALVSALLAHGRVGTVKHMPGHPVTQGDTWRHLRAGAEVVVGLGDGRITIEREWTLLSALRDLESRGIDFALVEGFKSSALPKIAVGGIEAPNTLCQIELSDLDTERVSDLVRLVLDQPEIDLCCSVI